ncbi:MAG: hypothetical protein IT373_36085 [Polyangiaceae bacterium]|nr:hypothetical protein [Polyangiaceae bacterium]
MGIFEQAGELMRHATTVLDDVRLALGEARATLVALRPTVAALPDLVADTRTLVVEARTLLARLTPPLLEGLRDARALLADERQRREAGARSDTPGAPPP